MEKKYILIDNKRKNTLVCVHGYNSSKDFIGSLGEEIKNFNILSFSLPGSIENQVDHEIDMDILSKSLMSQIAKLKHTNVYILAHSMGGAITNNMFKFLSKKQLSKIEHIFYLSTVHPLLPQATISRILKKYLETQSLKAKVVSQILKKSTKIAEKAMKKDLSHFIDKAHPWIPLLKVVNNKDNYDKLNKEYELVKDKSTFIVGDNDRTISSKLFIKYVEKTLNQEVHVTEAKHSPLQENLGEVVKILEEKIPNKSRFFLWKNIYKTK